jgi:hypothetical protein
MPSDEALDEMEAALPDIALCAEEELSLITDLLRDTTLEMHNEYARLRRLDDLLTRYGAKVACRRITLREEKAHGTPTA